MIWQCWVDDWVIVSEDCFIGVQVYEIGIYIGWVVYYRVCNIDDCYYGFGEKLGDLECIGCIFDMRCLDVLGYDVGSIDFLYKYVFFFMICIVNGVFGIFYDNLLVL